MKPLIILITIVLCIQVVFSSATKTVLGESANIKELNFVFLHGAGGSTCAMQLLADSITEQIPAYILEFENANPDTKIQVDMLQRCYPNDVDINTWANNIASTINKYLPNKKNLILIGHSMGGKTALYAVARNIGNLHDKVAAVVTINSPIKRMDDYYTAGGISPIDYCRARFQEVCDSVIYYDSSPDGEWVGSNKHWLAFISGEATPLSEQFDFGGIDALPRNMDDGIIPISDQYSNGADVIYYGEYGHSDFSKSVEVSRFMAEQILHYLFGDSIECSVLARGGIFDHRAGWFPGRDYWEDSVGEVLVTNGEFEHRNESYFNWEEWDDIIGSSSCKGERSSYEVNRVRSLPILTNVEESDWLNPDDSKDCRLRIKTKVAPRSSIRVEWSIYRQGLLPEEVERDHYEVEIVTGTPLTSIKQVSWKTDNPRDLRLQIYSEAEKPFRWFRTEWRVYFRQTRRSKIIEEIT